MNATVHVNLGPRSYDIKLGNHLLQDAAAHIKSLVLSRRYIVVTDTNVGDRYAAAIVEPLQTSSTRCSLLTIPAGEVSKSHSEAYRLWNELLRHGADRHTVVIALGGGVVGDLAGFVAATFARGLPYIQVPTTLLAQVDSSVGGKVAINLDAAKNMVGCFWQPRYVLIDPSLLHSLPKREYVAGLAEVVKYGVIRDRALFGQLERHTAAILEQETVVLESIIARCCQIKADVVQADEREESGERAILNYGHTFAHALEAVTHYGTYLHGEAVAWGMRCAARLAEQLDMVGAEFVGRQDAILDAFGLQIDTKTVDKSQLLRAMQHDKKSHQGGLQFVLPDQIGNVRLVGDIEAERIEHAMSASWRA